MADLWLPAEHDVTVAIRDGKLTVSEQVTMMQHPVRRDLGFRAGIPPLPRPEGKTKPPR